MTATTIRSSEVDAGSARALQMAYRSLVRAGNDSVRAAWRFGQTIDSLSDSYTQDQLAAAIDLSRSTIYRYVRLYRAYQRPELATAAAAQLETFNIDLIVELQNQLRPIGHGRPMAGRHWHYTCRGCGSHDVAREETEGEATDE
jgi:hypothetical protein